MFMLIILTSMKKNIFLLHSLSYAQQNRQEHRLPPQSPSSAGSPHVCLTISHLTSTPWASFGLFSLIQNLRTRIGHKKTRDFTFWSCESRTCCTNSQPASFHVPVLARITDVGQMLRCINFASLWRKPSPSKTCGVVIHKIWTTDKTYELGSK